MSSGTHPWVPAKFVHMLSNGSTSHCFAFILAVVSSSLKINLLFSCCGHSKPKWCVYTINGLEIVFREHISNFTCLISRNIFLTHIRKCNGYPHDCHWDVTPRDSSRVWAGNTLRCGVWTRGAQSWPTKTAGLRFSQQITFCRVMSHVSRRRQKVARELTASSSEQLGLNYLTQFSHSILGVTNR